jgi:hypothetical protein
MPAARLLINSLSGGVGRQVPSKRLSTEAENLDNCLVTLEKSVEKRPPLSSIKSEGLDYLNIPLSTPTLSELNTDNLYFHFLDVDGFNRYCIVINRGGYSFDPVSSNSFSNANGNLSLPNFISVYRIEPTEWIKETVTSDVGYVNNNNGFNRGFFEYLTFGNKNTTSSYYIGGKQIENVSATSINNTFGSIDFGVGVLLWNKLVPLTFLPDNSLQDLNTTQGLNEWSWTQFFSKGKFIHSGDTINYKTTTGFVSGTSAYNEDVDWPNVRDDVVYEIDPDTLEEEEQGQNLESFESIPQFPLEEIKSDVADANGFKASRTLSHLYDAPLVISFGANNIVDWSTDQYYATSPLPKLERDLNPIDSEVLNGVGKVYYARNPYLSFPLGYYRITRYSKNPYIEKIRTEEPNSVFDHRCFPIHIFKDTDGVWRVRHFPLEPRTSGNEVSNPGPIAFKTNDKIQTMAFWKSRLWVGTNGSIFASQTGNYGNFWINNVATITDTDPIDLLSNIGSYNKLTHFLPYRNIMFVTTSGSTQLTINGGSLDVGLSPFNVEIQPISFYSTTKLTKPIRLANNVFYYDSGKMYMFSGVSDSLDQYGISTEVSKHCRGYLPDSISTFEACASTNTSLFIDSEKENEIYLHTFRTQNGEAIQNCFYRWILDEYDNVKAMKTYEKDLYLISKRPTGNTGQTIVVVYYVSLESVPAETPMIDALTLVSPEDMVYSSETQTTEILLRKYDPNINYIVKAPNSSNSWGINTYEAIKLENLGSLKILPRSVTHLTSITVNGDLTKGPVYVGRSYEMNIELSEQVRRVEETQQVYEGVLNLKRITTKHFNSGAYDIEIIRKNRPSTKSSFFFTDINNILTPADSLRIDKTGEHYCQILSYSNNTKIFIKSDYPTPCNISNIEIIGNFRPRNTSIE